MQIVAHSLLSGGFSDTETIDTTVWHILLFNKVLPHDQKITYFLEGLVLKPVEVDMYERLGMLEF